MSGRRTKISNAESGSILLAVLAILSILAVTITVILMFGSWQKARGVFLLEETKTRYLAESGIHLAMAALATDPSHFLWSQNLALDSANQIEYTVRPWGAYLQVRSTGKGRRNRHSLLGEIGAKPPLVFDHALIPLGQPYPLVLSGRTSIQGDIYVERAGIASGEINGRGYEREELVFGKIDTLDVSLLPRFDDTIVDSFLQSLQSIKRDASPTDLALVYQDNNGLSNSLVSSTLAIYTRSDIVFDLRDSIAPERPEYFFADRSIRVDNNSQLQGRVLYAESVSIRHQVRLEDCIIVADEVQLTDAASFSGQIIAFDTVRIEGAAEVESPSLILLRGRRQGERLVGEVTVATSAIVQTMIIHGRGGRDKAEGAAEESACQLVLERGSAVRGLLWWEGLAGLHGRFEGAAAVSLFSHYEVPTTYMNWLVDADIRYLDVATEIAFPLLFKPNGLPKLQRMGDVRAL